MQYNRGRCNFCNMIFEGESRPICGRFGLKNRKEDLYEIKNNKRPCILFGDLPNAGQHAVVVYGYNVNDTI